MKNARSFGFVVMLALAGVMTACSSGPTAESTGQYLDDSGTTSKVKAAILAEPGLKSLQIGVETFKGEVQLSGFVDSLPTKIHAGKVTADVPGVLAVRNNLVVK